MKNLSVFFALLVAGLVLAAGAAPSAAEDAAQLMTDSHLAYYYAGDGGHAKVAMTIADKKGRERAREFWMLRRDLADLGDQRYFTYFIKPADVRQTAFLVHKQPDGNDDRWLYVPALDLVKRIAADDRSSSFVGSDFSYEDVSGRLPSLDAHTLLGEEAVGERPAYKIESTPKDPGTAAWSRKLTWVCKASKLPLREEYYDKKGELQRVFTIDAVEPVGGIPTGVKRTMADVKAGTRTVLSFSDVAYHAKLDAAAFDERLLKNPPREYTQ